MFFALWPLLKVVRLSQPLWALAAKGASPTNGGGGPALFPAQVNHIINLPKNDEMAVAFRPVVMRTGDRRFVHSLGLSSAELGLAEGNSRSPWGGFAASLWRSSRSFGGLSQPVGGQLS